MNIPRNILTVLDCLHAAGHEAYVIGGCVRDHLMGLQPHDFDITTSALPEETMAVFEGWRVIETGLKHGTVTVMSENEPVEITTFRVDGEYADGRHPDSVSFTRSLREDCARRDFTMNGIAFAPDVGFCDHFGGMEDIKQGIIRCIGSPDKRFGEDALRILRALRFAAVLGFDIEEQTADSLVRNRALLEKVSAERIFEELKKLLCGKYAENVLRVFPEVFAQIIPELAPGIGYEQGSRFHDSDLYTHTARAVGAAENTLTVRLAMLLHDIGKLHCRTQDESGECHYYGHGAISARLAEDILRRLKCDNDTRERVCRIIKYHDMPIDGSPRTMRRMLSKHGLDGVHEIIAAHIADDYGKRPECQDRIEGYRAALATAEEIFAEQPCLSVRELAIKGGDIAHLVPPSPKMGEILSQLLSEVVDGVLSNERAALLKRAEELV